MTRQQRYRILKIMAKKATPGPWRAIELANAPDPECCVESMTRTVAVMGHGSNARTPEERRRRADDASFVAALSPPVVLELVDRAESLETFIRQVLAAMPEGLPTILLREKAEKLLGDA